MLRRTPHPLTSGAAAAALLAALLAAASVPARAEDGAPLARLSAGERAVLERRIPGLESLPREKQEQIVRNVERLRTLDARHRELMVRRLSDARAAHLGAEELDERRRSLGSLDGPRAKLAEWQGVGIKALGLVAWRDLPAALREHPALSGLARHEFMQAFHRRYWSQAVEGLDAAQVAAYQPPASLPAPWRERFERARRAAEAAPEDAKAARQLRDVVLQGQALLAVREALAPAAPAPTVPGPEGRLLRLGERLREVARPAYDATLAGFVRLAEERGPERLAERLRELARPPAPPPEVQRKLDSVRVVFALEGLNDVLLRHPDLAAGADRLLRTALVDGLGMTVEEFERLPLRSAPEERVQALRGWAEKRVPPGEGRREWQRRGGKPR